VKWSNYNQSLVRRGKILLGFDVINNRNADLKKMNKDKIGEPFHLPFIQTEGIIVPENMPMEKYFHFRLYYNK
jgi:hypothetical protein